MSQESVEGSRKRKCPFLDCLPDTLHNGISRWCNATEGGARKRRRSNGEETSQQGSQKKNADSTAAAAAAALQRRCPGGEVSEQRGSRNLSLNEAEVKIDVLEESVVDFDVRQRSHDAEVCAAYQACWKARAELEEAREAAFVDDGWKKKIESLEAKLKQAESTIDARTEEVLDVLSDHKKDKQEDSKKIEELETRSKTLHDLTVQRGTNASYWKAQFDSLTTQHDTDMNNALSNHNNQVTQYEAQLQEKDRRYQGLFNYVQQFKADARIEHFQIVSAKDKEIVDLKAELAEKNKLIAQQEWQLQADPVMQIKGDHKQQGHPGDEEMTDFECHQVEPAVTEIPFTQQPLAACTNGTYVPEEISQQYDLNAAWQIEAMAQVPQDEGYDSFLDGEQADEIRNMSLGYDSGAAIPGQEPLPSYNTIVPVNASAVMGQGAGNASGALVSAMPRFDAWDPDSVNALNQTNHFYTPQQIGFTQGMDASAIGNPSPNVSMSGEAASHANGQSPEDDDPDNLKGQFEAVFKRVEAEDAARANAAANTIVISMATGSKATAHGPTDVDMNDGNKPATNNGAIRDIPPSGPPPVMPSSSAFYGRTKCPSPKTVPADSPLRLNDSDLMPKWYRQPKPTSSTTSAGSNAPFLENNQSMFGNQPSSSSQAAGNPATSPSTTPDSMIDPRLRTTPTTSYAPESIAIQTNWTNHGFTSGKPVGTFGKQSNQQDTSSGHTKTSQPQTQLPGYKYNGPGARPTRIVPSGQISSPSTNTPAAGLTTNSPNPSLSSGASGPAGIAQQAASSGNGTSPARLANQTSSNRPTPSGQSFFPPNHPVNASPASTSSGFPFSERAGSGTDAQTAVSNGSAAAPNGVATSSASLGAKSAGKKPMRDSGPAQGTATAPASRPSGNFASHHKDNCDTTKNLLGELERQPNQLTQDFTTPHRTTSASATSKPPTAGSKKGQTAMGKPSPLKHSEPAIYSDEELSDHDDSEFTQKDHWNAQDGK